MNTDSLLAPSPLTSAASDPAPAVRASIFRAPVLAALAGMRQGRLEIELPGGKVIAIGAEPESEIVPLGASAIRIPAVARLRVRRETFFRRCALYGDIGFAEAYRDGEWETPDLTAVISWFVRNHADAPTLSGSARARSWAVNSLRVANRLRHWLRPNSRATARRNISAHYDLSNEFFALFLDPSMMYSAAKWTEPHLGLEEAQEQKNDALCRKLRLQPTDHVLEIGTGWGGWAIQAARTYGCRVTSVTLSRQQCELARRRVAEAGLSDRVQVELRDYRDLTGTFDKIVSIEMMEAIGHKYLPDFCAVLHRVLKPDGLMAFQFITCPDARYDQFRRGVDFIQKHIFPGSLLLSLNRVNDCLSRAGGFVLHGVEDLGTDYALTLRHWQERFGARLAEVSALGFDERFIRNWSYYLSYCEAAFALRNISVVQTVHTRPNNLAIG
jgi:cyclopropane-fatty-acyl-phospholipid synthase